MIEVTAPALAGHPFLRGMPPGQLDVLAEAGADVSFPAGHRIFEDGGYAGKFWLLQSGHVTLDMQVPGQGQVIIDNVSMGELLGCSWFFPPYRWEFGAVCAGPVRAFEFDAAAVRARCAADPLFGYELTRRLLRVFARRLQSTRTRLITSSAARGAGRAGAEDA
jgi:CRP-like cAMP-binding protein